MSRIPLSRRPCATLNADLLVVVAFVVLPNEVLASTRLGAVNLHGSLLPKWRGAAPVQRSVEAGETETGGTIFRLDTGVDTGGIILQEKIAIGPDDTSGDILARLAEHGGRVASESRRSFAKPSGRRWHPPGSGARDAGPQAVSGRRTH
jgi:methionyl-tRNA formyltransferase